MSMENIMAFSKTTKKKERDSFGGQMANFIQDCGKMVRDMGLECGLLKKAIAIWDNGNRA